jgi:hypothetical protein
MYIGNSSIFTMHLNLPVVLRVTLLVIVYFCVLDGEKIQHNACTEKKLCSRLVMVCTYSSSVEYYRCRWRMVFCRNEKEDEEGKNGGDEGEVADLWVDQLAMIANDRGLVFDESSAS